MATENVEIKVVVSAGEAARSTDSLKTQIKEATKEAQALSQKFGDTSKEALAAQKKVAALKEEMSDFKQRIDALNPEAKFQAVAKLASGIAGGFGAATGAMALFGAESEDVQKALLKVQAALAISQGLNEIKGLGDAMSNFKIVALDAFDGLKKAIMANPLFTLAAVIGGVIAAFTIYLNLENEYSKEINKQIELNTKKFSIIEKGYDREIALARANGEDITLLEKRKLQATIDRITEEMRLTQLKYDEELKRAQNGLKAVGVFLGKGRKDELIANNTNNQSLKKLTEELEKAKLDLEVKGVEEKKKLRDTDLKNYKEYLAGQEKANKEALDRIFNDIKGFNRDRESEQAASVARIAEFAGGEDDTSTLDFFEKVRVEKENLLKLEQESNNALLAAKNEFNDAAFNATSAGINLLGTLAGKNEKLANTLFILDKALAIGKVIVDTIKANAAITLATNAQAAIYASNPVTAALAGQAIAAGVAGRNANRLNAAASIAALAASTFAKFKSGAGGVPSISGGGSFGGGGGTPSSGDTANPPNFGTTQIDRDKGNQGQPIVIKNVIAETDISQVQKRVGIIQERATIR